MSNWAEHRFQIWVKSETGDAYSGDAYIKKRVSFHTSFQPSNNILQESYRSFHSPASLKTFVFHMHKKFLPDIVWHQPIEIVDCYPSMKLKVHVQIVIGKP